MTKPWDHPPGKIFRPNKPEAQVEESLKARAEWEKKWEAIFGKKKLNNMEDEGRKN